MKRRLVRHKRLSHRHRIRWDDSPQGWRHWPIWKPIAVLIPIIAAALTIRGCLG